MSIKTTYSAPDIVCDGCATAIQNALGKVSGVSFVNVDVAAQTVQVTHDSDAVPPAAIVHALDRAGYTATLVE